MDDTIRSAAEGDPHAILALSQGVKESGVGEDAVCRAVEAVHKAVRKDIRTSCALSDSVSSFIRSAVHLCLSASSGTSEKVTAAVLDLIGDAFLNPRYLHWPASDTGPVFQLLAESVSVKRDSLLCGAALRAIAGIGCSTDTSVDNKRLLLAGLLEVVRECDRGADCQLALSALESLLEDVPVEAGEVCGALRVFFDKTEGVWGEFLIPQMLKDPNTHQALCDSGVYTEFVTRCQLDEDGQWNGQLGEAVESVIVDYGHGSPLYGEAVKAQCSKAFAAYNVHLLTASADKDDDEHADVKKALRNLDRMLATGGPAAVTFAQHAGTQQAIEATVCRIALDPRVPVVDKDIRGLARTVLHSIKQGK